jgi:hypothetical protein
VSANFSASSEHGLIEHLNDFGTLEKPVSAPWSIKLDRGTYLTSVSVNCSTEPNASSEAESAALEISNVARMETILIQRDEYAR